MTDLVSVLKRFKSNIMDRVESDNAASTSSSPSEQQQSGANVSLENMVWHRLASLCSASLSSLILANDDLLALYLEHLEISDLTQIAFCKTSSDESLAVPTAMLNDRSLVMSSMLLNRCRAYEQIGVELSHSGKSIRFSIKSPSIEFNAEFTSLGRKLEARKQGIAGLSRTSRGRLKGELSYIRLFGDITERQCRGKIVWFVDT